jgi:hypothetical protein
LFFSSLFFFFFFFFFCCHQTDSSKYKQAKYSIATLNFESFLKLFLSWNLNSEMGRLHSLLFSLLLLIIRALFTETKPTIFSEGVPAKEMAFLFSQNVSGAIMQTNSIGGVQSQCFHERNMIFNDAHIVKEARKMKKAEISLVSLPRMIASLWLARAALSLPAPGDFVETGEVVVTRIYFDSNCLYIIYYMRPLHILIFLIMNDRGI